MSTNNKKVTVTDIDKSIMWNACVRAFSHGQKGIEEYMTENITTEAQLMGIKALFEEYVYALCGVVDSVLIDANQVPDDAFIPFCDHLMSLGQLEYEDIVGNKINIPKEIWATIGNSNQVFQLLVSTGAFTTKDGTVIDEEQCNQLRTEAIKSQRWRLLNRKDRFIYDEKGQIRKASFSFRDAFQTQIDRFQKIKTIKTKQ